MALPSSLLKHKPTADKKGGGADDLLGADLGDGGEIEEIRPRPAGDLAAVASAPTPTPIPADRPAPATDQAAVKALVSASLRQDPMLAMAVRSKGPLAKERINVTLDLKTLQRWRELALSREQTTSSLLIETILPWAKANTERTSLIWASKQVSSGRKVALKHLRAAKEGTEELIAGSSPEIIYYPVASLNNVKSLWEASGLKKKPFFEACVYLYLEIHAPRK